MGNTNSNDNVLLCSKVNYNSKLNRITQLIQKTKLNICNLILQLRLKYLSLLKSSKATTHLQIIFI